MLPSYRCNNRFYPGTMLSRPAISSMSSPLFRCQFRFHYDVIVQRHRFYCDVIGAVDSKTSILY